MYTRPDPVSTSLNCESHAQNRLRSLNVKYFAITSNLLFFQDNIPAIWRKFSFLVLCGYLLKNLKTFFFHSTKCKEYGHFSVISRNSKDMIFLYDF